MRMAIGEVERNEWPFNADNAGPWIPAASQGNGTLMLTDNTDSSDDCVLTNSDLPASLR
jgi:hypothetical protein